MDRDHLGSWKPGERVGRLVGWLLLLLSTATILTNAYYLRFLEPTVSRKVIAFLFVAATGLWFLVWRFGLPRNRTEAGELFRRARTPLFLALILGVAFSLRYAGAGSGLWAHGRRWPCRSAGAKPALVARLCAGCSQ